MTLEEIVKSEDRQPDCCGYVTKYDIECSDGLTIRQGAFVEDDGKKVPMVWMHDHKDLENVLGHVYLESRDDGMYGYGYMNDSPRGQLAKLYVDHGDISAFSIYANKLKKKAKDVVHGMIREVSLVLAGANRGAIIDGPIAHSDDDTENDGVICMGEDYGGPIYGNDEALTVEDYIAHYGRKGMKWGKNLFAEEYVPHPREKNITGEGKLIGRKDEGLGTGPVGNTVVTRPGETEATMQSLNMEAIQNAVNNAIASLGEDFNSLSDTAKAKFKSMLEQAVVAGAKASEMVKETAENAGGKAKESWSFVTDSAKNARDAAAEKASDAIREIKGQAEEAKEDLSKKVENVAGKVGEGAKKLTEKVESAKATVKETAKANAAKAAASASAVASNTANNAKNAGYRFVKNFKETGKKAVDKVSEGINNVPEAAKTAAYNTGKAIHDTKEDIKNTVNSASNTAKETYNKASEGIKNAAASASNSAKETYAKAVESTKEALDSLKDLGEKALNSGKEVGAKANDIFEDAKKKLKDLFKHDDLTDDDAEEIIMHYIDGEITMDEILEHADSGKTYAQVLSEMNDEQLATVYYMLKKARTILADENLKHSEMEDDEMKHNVFDDASESREATLSHADMEKLASDVFRDAKSKGSLKDAFLAHAEDYGIDNIEYLFPEDRNLNNPPTWIKRPDGWVSKVMKGVHHSPFSRIKSMFADITEADARAKGYTKGNRKIEEVFGLLKRSTSPTTVYKKQKLDRDDIIDITDFDVVSWLKTEMRGMLDEELARAFLVSDGRSPASNDKINEQNIRPIWTDDDLFTIHKAIATTASTTTDELCKQFIRTAIKARKDYKGSGNPTLFTTEDMLADMLLLEDQIGHALYETQDKLAAKLRVKEIVTVPVFENLTRINNGMTMSLLGIIVNLDDYNVGADKGGSVAMFEDFDIDYNQEKYLIETRCSGALTKPYSAIVIESTSSIYLELEVDDPSTTRYGKTVASLQEDVVVNDDSIGGTLKYVTGYTGFSGEAEEQSGNYLALKINVPDGATSTLQLVGGGASGNTVDFGEDDYFVVRIKSKNTKIVLTTTKSGVTISKTYSLRLLKLEKP